MKEMILELIMQSMILYTDGGDDDDDTITGGGGYDTLAGDPSLHCLDPKKDEKV